jgi:hypothetical protein|tara:strand:+ start:2476 stop:2892 length:417 start_codon:yes stop_codon:yes gene_type:complete
MSEYILYLTPILALSLVANVILFWFARTSSRKLTIVASNIDEIMNAIENFENHLETIYEMETFYGDETLQSVLNHAKGIKDFLSGFEDIYELLDDLPDEREEEWEETNDNKTSGDTTGTTEEKEEKKTNKKIVFHSGT